MQRDEATDLLILQAMHDRHALSKPMPSNADLRKLTGLAPVKLQSYLNGMIVDGLLTGMIGEKPTGLTTAGKQFVGAAWAPAVIAPAAAPPVKLSLTETVASKFGIDPNRMFDLVAKTMISKGRNDGPATKEEVAVVMHIMNKYDLDPLLKQLHAFMSQGKLQVMLGYDGWVAQVRRAHGSGLMGITFRESDELVQVPGTAHKVPAWIEATADWVPSAGRSPTVYKAFFSEWFVSGDNWRARPYHRLRMKAYCQCVREALGIGLSDEVDRDQFQWMDDADVRVMEQTAKKQGGILERLRDLPEPPGLSPLDVEAEEGFSLEEASQRASDEDMDLQLIAEQRARGEI
jgi:hypothetical protein